MVKQILHEKAIELRKQKYSYRQIANKLNLSKSTVSKWLGVYSWSNSMIDRLAEEAKGRNQQHLQRMASIRKMQHQKKRNEAASQAVDEFAKLVKNPIFLIGLGIYWGEGDKNTANGLVRISNIDPVMIKWFVVFLRRVCLVPMERIKLWILLYPDLNDEICRKYWQKMCRVKSGQFVKSQVITGRHPSKRLTYGVCNLYVSDSLLKQKFLTWIKLLGKMDLLKLRV